MQPEFLRARAHIVAALRKSFEGRGYLEVHTPTLVPSPALEEHLEALQLAEGPEPHEDRYLHTSPEFAMKRVLGAGLGRIYQITPCFRAEESGPNHAREFTMLEWYRVGADLESLARETEELLHVAGKAVGVNLPAFRRVRACDALDPELPPVEWFREWVSSIEPTFKGPVLVLDYPSWQAALARIQGQVARRFEVYIDGLELGNAFDEEPDPEELRRRFEQSARERSAAGRRPHPIDEQFLTSVGRMPRCSGIAIGVDRLVMALTGAKHIRQVQAVRDEPPDNGALAR